MSYKYIHRKVSVQNGNIHFCVKAEIKISLGDGKVKINERYQCSYFVLWLDGHRISSLLLFFSAFCSEITPERFSRRPNKMQTTKENWKWQASCNLVVFFFKDDSYNWGSICVTHNICKSLCTREKLLPQFLKRKQLMKVKWICGIIWHSESLLQKDP